MTAKESISKKIAVIGGGPMGLTCAYCLAKKGHSVDVYEADSILGGMSAHFDFSGLDIEKYYHFVCGPDYPLFNLMKELQIFDRLRWTDTKMGLFYDGTLYKWGGPFELLSFPKAGLFLKLRYGFHVFYASKIKNWHKLDDTTSLDWIKKWEGKKGYDMFWDSLFQLKFYDLKSKISAPWLWSRLARVAKSRKSIFQERMGYISGGSIVVINALADKIKEYGGRIHTSSPVDEIVFENNAVSGIKINGQFINYDIVASTIPIQYLTKIAPSLPKIDKDKLKLLDNVGVVCVIVKLSQALTENFWLNISDNEMDIPGIIEISNLNTELKEHVQYVPFYLHKDNPKYSLPDDYFIDKVKGYLIRVNPSITPDKVKDIRVFRYEYAQPVSTTHFLEKLPPIYSDGRKGFYMSDTAYCYPEDRSITESIKAAVNIADVIEKTI
ncbi:NAD(P)/FAD-dependent oxidoreductase [Methanomicrobium mobile]|uniref:NAD(P)/FAD-dependent oxidoreductase n=1 Tax=Methanomicrobium mobile TaxID=2205 RepID=UPI0005B2B99D|nr:NAD(P)/FAD-dependent oxidoreductase [Methanomicrobium mobile]